jgi:hypothetical protein
VVGGVFLGVDWPYCLALTIDPTKGRGSR